MPARPLPVLCRPNDLHVAQTARLWIVTGRVTDHARWTRQLADDPEPAAEWPAELLRQGRGVLLGPVADSIAYGEGQALMPIDPSRLFIAAISRSTHHLIGGMTLTGDELLGGIGRTHRRQGYGREMLAAVCQLAHRHFDVPRLTAVSAPGNEAARRWLAGAGFTPDGTAGVTLDGTAGFTSDGTAGVTPDGAGWERSDAGHSLRCPRPRSASAR
ncbi:RimJ/RimL family protein N-acetyltransferase [Catenuloplanes nepalensis]|uniref:RimJ/RimL family protein N-acetyltransferase n=1 Tax=Catenuloplanes nepalensis TaxID=587533 RepID=A0ABT9MVH4_9ACTN|nr:GNAT family N-acetyltransferase [Catenuloplanes nepalensis]MDP9795437.1 RimJ/RimL family protein N-acetyltransferase [Catenuloplanes nepalensis]